MSVWWTRDPHKDLAALGGRYAALFDLQTASYRKERYASDARSRASMRSSTFPTRLSQAPSNTNTSTPSHSS